MKYVLATSSPSQGSVTIGSIYEVAGLYDKQLIEVENFDDATSLHIILPSEVNDRKSRMQCNTEYFKPAPFKPYVIDVIEQKVREWLDTNTKVKYNCNLTHKNGWHLVWGIVMKSDKNGTLDCSSACNTLLATDIMYEAFGKDIDDAMANKIQSGGYFLYQLVKYLVVRWRFDEKKKQEEEANKKIRDMRKWTSPNLKETEVCL